MGTTPAPIHCRGSISKLIYILDGLRVKTFSANFIFGWTIPLKTATQKARKKLLAFWTFDFHIYFFLCNLFFICNRCGNGFSAGAINADHRNNGTIFIYLSVHFLITWETPSNELLEVSFQVHVYSLLICNNHFENHIICSKSARASRQMLPVNVAVTVSAISASMNTRNQLGGRHLDPPFTDGETLDVLVFLQSDIRFRTTKCKPTAIWHII